MFSGIQEILVLVIIILGILLLPRILNRGPESSTGAAKPAFETGEASFIIGNRILEPGCLMLDASFHFPTSAFRLPNF